MTKTLQLIARTTQWVVLVVAMWLFMWAAFQPAIRFTTAMNACGVEGRVGLDAAVLAAMGVFLGWIGSSPMYNWPLAIASTVANVCFLLNFFPLILDRSKSTRVLFVYTVCVFVIFAWGSMSPARDGVCGILPGYWAWAIFHLLILMLLLVAHRYRGFRFFFDNGKGP